jgi:nucleoside-diphosphate-sugar epimerase
MITKTIITLTDRDDGDTEVKVICDPPAKNEQLATKEQQMALDMLIHLAAQYDVEILTNTQSEFVEDCNVPKSTSKVVLRLLIKT